ncbi:MAG TPA: CUAEP/CCAEP-tail radical SAM protein [Acidimicrobiia bacterium]|nr:CUAEP/CCAEP-tail radical SAM protein [Acidimicrobiia bacterium]
MRLLLVSTYELGHQPLHLAAPAAALRAAGHEVRTVDTSVEPWSREPVDWADAVAFSVPMHTAMRLALRAAASVRAARPELPICLYGLYATVSQDVTLGPDGVADRAIAGEYEKGLVAWADELTTAGPAGEPAGDPPSDTQPVVAVRPRTRHSNATGRGSDEGPGNSFVDVGRRRPAAVPARGGLPPLERYAHLALGGEERPVGYVEASRGCLHRCGHCPVPVVYDGRIRIVPEDVVLADIEALVATGAKHITFGDPDFLNGPQHSRRIVAAMHGRWPELTFDCTVKVEHILRHADLWPEIAAAGCLFVVSAFETVHEETLLRLDKGHTAADAAAAVQLLRGHGIEIRPSFLPFTPWTTVDEVADIVDFVAALDLVPNVDPVQYTIRLLVPQGSLLESTLATEGRLGPYDAERLTWTWTSADPSVDELQTRLTALVEGGQTAGESISRIYQRVQQAVWAAAGRDASGFCPPLRPFSAMVERRPRLTEPWFC